MGERVTISRDGGGVEGYLALPASGATGPAVVVVHAWWGLVPHVTVVADRFAEAGFVAIAPDLYDGATTDDPEEAGKLVAALDADRVAESLDAAAHLVADRAGGGDRVGCVGFSTGGSLAVWSATRSARITATVGFYPRLTWDRLEPDWSGYAGKAVVVHCAAEDGGASAEQVRQLHTGVTAAGGDCAAFEYPDTRHAFFNDDRPDTYDRQAAASAWARTIEFFRTRLG